MRARRALASALALVAAAAWAAGAAAAPVGSRDGASSAWCDRARPLSAVEQDRLLSFAAIVRDELDRGGAQVALVSRSGLDLSRFGLRYSHAALGWRGQDGAWSARQLYYACDEGRPRLYDQGLPGFVSGVDDPAVGHVSIVRLPPEVADETRVALLDDGRAGRLLAASYSATAYPFSLRHQNCNQWVAELLAAAWGGLADGPDLRRRAQAYLQAAGYAPEPVAVDSHLLMFAAGFVPLLRLDDHPRDELYALRLTTSLPPALEAFARRHDPRSERTELCHRGRRVVVHQGWTPIADGCVPGPGDRVMELD